MRTLITAIVLALSSSAVAQETKKVLPDSNLWVANNYDTLILDSLLIDAKENGRPLLLYFYGSNNVNTWKFNSNVLSDSTISTYIRSSFYPIKFDVEARVPTAKRGKRNFEFQYKTFSYSTQPFFVIISLDGTVVSKQGYLGNEKKLKESFLRFLAAGLDACED